MNNLLIGITTGKDLVSRLRMCYPKHDKDQIIELIKELVKEEKNNIDEYVETEYFMRCTNETSNRFRIYHEALMDINEVRRRI